MEKSTFLKNTKIELNREYIDMYDISGQDSVSEHSLIRYKKDKEQDILIDNQVKISPVLFKENHYINIVNPSEEFIKFTKKDEIFSLIESKLKNQDIQVQLEGVKNIRYASDQEKDLLYKVAIENIKNGLNNHNINIQKILINMIKYIPKQERDSLIRSYLEDPSIEIQKIAASMSGYVPTEVRQNLFDFVIKRGLGEDLIKPPLYKDKDLDNKNFSRQDFEKTGSGLTLIGGELKDKIIIRHISPVSFKAWQKAFESCDFWKKSGFDYVPVEPIVSYRLSKSGLVDVYSGVLDLSLGDWGEKTLLFRNELQDQRDKIISVLNNLQIKHGHTKHDYNFCLRFFRDENGKPEFNRAPRVYVIDFDQATLINN